MPVYFETTTVRKETHMCARKRYGILNFLGDALMVGITGGLWVIWIFVREMRMRNR